MHQQLLVTVKHLSLSVSLLAWIQACDLKLLHVKALLSHLIFSIFINIHVEQPLYLLHFDVSEGTVAANLISEGRQKLLFLMQIACMSRDVCFSHTAMNGAFCSGRKATLMSQNVTFC